MADYNNQIKAGGARDERNVRNRLNRNECGYEEAYERERRDGDAACRKHQRPQRAKILVCCWGMWLDICKSF